MHPDHSDDQYQPWQLERLQNDSASRLPTAAEMEQIVVSVQRQAHQEGYQAGFKEGHRDGYQQGESDVRAEAARLQEQIAAAQEQVRRLEALMGVAQDAMLQMQHALGQDVLALALDVSRQMLRQALKVKPELLLPMVRSMMEATPQHSQHPHLHLHPDDALLVKSHMQTELSAAGWKVVDDPRIERGGCRIETATSEVDATLPARWKNIASALAQDMQWLDE